MGWFSRRGSKLPLRQEIELAHLFASFRNDGENGEDFRVGLFLKYSNRVKALREENYDVSTHERTVERYVPIFIKQTA